MKKIAAITWMMISGIVLTSNALAGSAEKDMCVSKVNPFVR